MPGLAMDLSPELAQAPESIIRCHTFGAEWITDSLNQSVFCLWKLCRAGDTAAPVAGPEAPASQR